MKRIFPFLILTICCGLLLSSCSLMETLNLTGRSCQTCVSRVITAEEQGYTTIDAAQANAMIEAGGAVLIDVRTAEEYTEAHIPNALLVPSEDIGDQPPAQLQDFAKDQVLLLYCRSGNRSAASAAKLVEMGYTQVYDFGGIQDWPYETESGAAN